ncbi:MAG: 3-deoxy-D-manno-octulosonic acid transferase [Deltaproteobacteria bacterium]|nr:3-deoxy-D-manno-octulosonic acid transferase [Deltaproteobacteria bacterium]
MGVTGRYASHFLERLGRIPHDRRQALSGRPRIWIHAVSLGEVRVAGSLIDTLKQELPACRVILSTTTAHGREMAKEQLKEDVPVIYAPIDLIWCVRKALGTIRPDVMVFLETEIWPAWLFEARRMGIRTALINGRISIRSINGYLKIRSFIKQVLGHMDVFSMILEADARRIIAMGARADRVEVNGNAKYDRLISAVDGKLEEKNRLLLNLKPSDRVLVAGSTRQGEEEMILEAYRDILKHCPDTILILAPRHVERASAIHRMTTRQGFSCQLRSRIKKGQSHRMAQVVVLDTFGELFGMYSVASIVFLGASLVPLGGQNPLEPAVWGKPVLYGPSMEDFLDAKGILESADAGICISTPAEFSETVRRLFADDKMRTSMGERARAAVMQHRGAARQQAAVVMRLAHQNAPQHGPRL